MASEPEPIHIARTLSRECVYFVRCGRADHGQHQLIHIVTKLGPGREGAGHRFVGRPDPDAGPVTLKTPQACTATGSAGSTYTSAWRTARAWPMPRSSLTRKNPKRSGSCAESRTRWMGGRRRPRGGAVVETADVLGGGEVELRTGAPDADGDQLGLTVIARYARSGTGIESAGRRSTASRWLARRPAMRRARSPRRA